MNHKTVVINMLSGPGSGKSTLAAELFVKMKKMGYRVEYLQEYAKKLVWQKEFDILNNQHLVSYKYYKSIASMNGHLDYIILDSSLLNGIWYNKNNVDNVSNIEKTEEMILKCYKEFNNINFFINRGSYAYETAGRIQSENESKQIDNDIKDILNDIGISSISLDMNEDNIIEKMLLYIKS
jgi:hypothetical protein